MNNIEQCLPYINELVDGIDLGDFEPGSVIPSMYTFMHLYALLLMKDELDGAEELFNQLHDRSVECGINMLRDKLLRRERIRVAFLTYSSAQWPAEKLYHMFERDQRFEPYVVTMALTERTSELRRGTYEQVVAFFKDGGYRVYEGHDLVSDTARKWEEIGGMPDIVVHLSSWNESTAPQFWVWNMPLTILQVYIPYGIALVENMDGTYMKDCIYDKPFCNMMWRIYTDSIINLESYEKYEYLHGKNVRYSGFIKMDHFYDTQEYSAEKIEKIWKIPNDNGNMKRVIIAPHYSVYNKGVVLLSTFHHNLWFLLYLAKKYQSRISFVFKPHPNLKLYGLGGGLFSSDSEFEAYLSEWESLPNARVVQEGDYLDLFSTSDGMIMDSGSFIGEYIYSHKPCLFLTRPEQRFNELGNACVESYYRVDGRDYAGIEAFLQNVILDGRDEKCESREAVFDEMLDYRRINGVGATEWVYRDILRNIE